MSENTTIETTETETTNTKPAKVEKPKKFAFKADEVDTMLAAAGVAVETMKSWKQAGPKNAVHLAVAKTKSVSRIYIYATHLSHPAVINYTDEDRKEKRLGGIKAEIDFDQPEELVRSALEMAIDAVKNQPPVEKKEKATPAPKKPRAKKAEAEAQQVEATA